jgi:hypothetical protein
VDDEIGYRCDDEYWCWWMAAVFGGVVVDLVLMCDSTDNPDNAITASF